MGVPMGDVRLTLEGSIKLFLPSGYRTFGPLAPEGGRSNGQVILGMRFEALNAKLARSFRKAVASCSADFTYAYRNLGCLDNVPQVAYAPLAAILTGGPFSPNSRCKTKSHQNSLAKE
jgi:hypothetical protein